MRNEQIIAEENKGHPVLRVLSPGMRRHYHTQLARRQIKYNSDRMDELLQHGNEYVFLEQRIDANRQDMVYSYLTAYLDHLRIADVQLNDMVLELSQAIKKIEERKMTEDEYKQWSNWVEDRSKR
jgi:acetolactate synthase small subunit